MFDFTIHASCGAARTGTLSLPHGAVETPVFMPVGTQGTVRALSPGDLKAVGSQLVLANTYHLHVRPAERCAKRHRELSDGRTVGQSDGQRLPVRPSDGPTVPQTLWPILQGGTHLGLREEGLRRILDLGAWTGLAIGGLSVGEPKPVMYEMLEGLEPRLPPSWPRYLMGVGFPEDLVTAVERGFDLFDCVAPTRNGRNGSAFTPDGPVNIRNAEHRDDARPLDATCDCESCATFSRGYLRHLFVAEELLGLRLLSLHNVRFLIRLTREMGAAIRAGTFPRWAAEWRRRYTRSD